MSLHPHRPSGAEQPQNRKGRSRRHLNDRQVTGRNSRDGHGVHVAATQRGVGQGLHPLPSLSLGASYQSGPAGPVAGGVSEDVARVDTQCDLEERDEHDDDEGTHHDELDDRGSGLVPDAQTARAQPEAGAVRARN